MSSAITDGFKWVTVVTTTAPSLISVPEGREKKEKKLTTVDFKMFSSAVRKSAKSRSREEECVYQLLYQPHT